MGCKINNILKDSERILRLLSSDPLSAPMGLGQ
jgi:hypothetical protein